MGKLQLTNKELIKELKRHPKDAKVNLSVIIDSNMLSHENGDEKGIYFVDGIVIDVRESFDESDLDIMAIDVNYKGW